MAKITVVIATKNVENLIRVTLDSIINQTLKDIEIVVIDSASTDSTLDVLLEYKGYISKLISEPDTGIYDAWNKATPYINSNWVQYLGAGDMLASKDVFQKMVEHLDNAYPIHNIVYGNLLLISEETGEEFEKVSVPSKDVGVKFINGRLTTPIHPETFSHITMIEKFGFDKRFRFAGDLKFMIQSTMESPPLYVDVDIDRMLVGGQSSDKRNIIAIYRETQVVNKELNVRVPLIHTVQYYILVHAIFLIYKIIHPKLLRYLINLKRVLIGKSAYPKM